MDVEIVEFFKYDKGDKSWDYIVYFIKLEYFTIEQIQILLLNSFIKILIIEVLIHCV